MNILAKPTAAGVCVAAALCATSSMASPERQHVVRTPVSDARPLLLAALSADDGVAHGVLTGELADAITLRFAATSPVFIDVSTERRFEQAGCARLKVLFWQDGVKLPDTNAVRKQTIEFGINYCLDGRPPGSLR